jgi:hypothetical protein
MGCANSPPVLPFADGSASAAELLAYQSKITARRDVRCHDWGELEIFCESKSQGPDWTFTRPGHPAHPAVSASIWVWYQTPQGQAIRIDRAGQFGGSKEAYEAWEEHLAVLDKEQLQTLDELALAK